MAWVRIESSVARHGKFLRAGPAASWLWLCSLAYCQEGLTDGFIPFEALEHLGVKGARGLRAKLVQERLWEEVDGGWMVHDYLQWNRNADTVRTIQATRRQAGANGGKASGAARAVEANPKQVASANPKQPSNPSTATATETTTATATPTYTAPIAGVRNEHRTHALCGRVCLPAFLFSEFTRRRGGNDPDAVVRLWAIQVLEVWRDKPEEPGESIAFWRARYEERWPSTATRPVKRDAITAFLEQGQ